MLQEKCSLPGSQAQEAAPSQLDSKVSPMSERRVQYESWLSPPSFMMQLAQWKREQREPARLSMSGLRAG
ncbi:MAG: hypothetical protein DRI34_04560 [Deltaproteobacteria bacterium]|nr:MAG: hypothetical protein DRI34_04560 [Deltaproteobacteria bacterium]